MKKNNLKSETERKRMQMIKFIAETITRVDARKLCNIYQFVLHII